MSEDEVEVELKDILTEPTRADKVGAGIVIFSTGLLLGFVGGRFHFLGTDDLDQHAAWIFWTVGAVLALVGISMIVTAFRRAAPEPPRIGH